MLESRESSYTLLGWFVRWKIIEIVRSFLLTIVTIVFAVDSQVRRETWMSLIFERKKYDKILIANIVYIYIQIAFKF